jgi:predicted N-acyltransferase
MSRASATTAFETARVEIVDGFDRARWIEGDDLQTAASWIECMASRAGEQPITLRVSTGDWGGAGLGTRKVSGSSAAALLCFENRDPERYESYNLGALALRVPPVFPWDDASELAALRRRHRIDEADLFPNVTAVLPGYRHPLVSTGPRGDELATTAVGALVEVTRRRGAVACAALYVPRGTEPLTSALRQRGFARIPLTSRAVLPIEWPDFEGYVDWLPRRARMQVRRDLRAIAQTGMRSRSGDPAGEIERVVHLRLAHLAKFGHPPDASSERARLSGLIQSFPADDLRLVITEHGGRAVSAMLALRRGDVLCGILGATDPERAPPLTHFENLYYAPLRTLEPGIARFDMGISHLASKVQRGCRLTPLDGWVWTADPARAAALAEVAALADRHNLEAPAVGASKPKRDLP